MERSGGQRGKAGLIQRHVWVSGTVQGVGFRASALKAARQFESLHGFVRNLSDGRVEAIFAGQEPEVLKMVAWCKAGPSTAQVTRIEVKEEDFDPSLRPFELLRSV